jgi:hypothetical protein
VSYPIQLSAIIQLASSFTPVRVPTVCSTDVAVDEVARSGGGLHSEIPVSFWLCTEQHLKHLRARREVSLHTEFWV